MKEGHSNLEQLTRDSAMFGRLSGKRDPFGRHIGRDRCSALICSKVQGVKLLVLRRLSIVAPGGVTSVLLLRLHFGVGVACRRAGGRAGGRTGGLLSAAGGQAA